MKEPKPFNPGGFTSMLEANKELADKIDWGETNKEPTLSDFDRIRLETAVSFTCALAHVQSVNFEDALEIADRAISHVMNTPFERMETKPASSAPIPG